MRALPPETIERLAGHILNARDKRIITFTVLVLYSATVIATFVLTALGRPVPKEALDSIETAFLVVVCAHLTASVATRGASAYVATKGSAAADPPGPAAAPGTAPAAKPEGS